LWYNKEKERIMSPENQLIADKYMEFKSIEKTAHMLKTTEDKIAKAIRRQDVRRYIDERFLETGFNNKHRVQELMDKIISNKLAEVEEAEVYTKKDLVELLQINHQMRAVEEKLAIERLKLEASLTAAKQRLQQTEILTGRKLEAATARLQLKLDHDKKLKEKETNAYSELISRLLSSEIKKEKDVIGTTYTIEGDRVC
jgi:hypothetical protein